jgi:hypothetical protein
LWLDYTPSNIGSTWSPRFTINQWFGGNTAANAAPVDSFIVYDNFRLWTGTGP